MTVSCTVQCHTLQVRDGRYPADVPGHGASALLMLHRLPGQWPGNMSLRNWGDIDINIDSMPFVACQPASGLFQAIKKRNILFRYQSFLWCQQPIMSLIVNNMIVFFSREANEWAFFRQRQGKESSCPGAEEAGHWSVMIDQRTQVSEEGFRRYFNKL